MSNNDITNKDFAEAAQILKSMQGVFTEISRDEREKMLKDTTELVTHIFHNHLNNGTSAVQMFTAISVLTSICAATLARIEGMPSKNLTAYILAIMERSLQQRARILEVMFADDNTDKHGGFEEEIAKEKNHRAN